MTDHCCAYCLCSCNIFGEEGIPRRQFVNETRASMSYTEVDSSLHGGLGFRVVQLGVDVYETGALSRSVSNDAKSLCQSSADLDMPSPAFVSPPQRVLNSEFVPIAYDAYISREADFCTRNISQYASDDVCICYLRLYRHSFFYSERQLSHNAKSASATAA